MIKPFLLASALAFTVLAQAQTAAKPAGSPAKKDLVAKVLQAQKPGVELMARRIVEQPALQMMQQAGQVIQQRVPADKREATFKELQADARKYVDETYPKVRDQANTLAPTTLGPLLEEKLTEDELKQVLAVFESAAWRKYQGLSGDMEKALMEKLAPQARPVVETNARALQQTLGRRLEAATGAGAGAASAPTPGK
jgi:hypothetical protein